MHCICVNSFALFPDVTNYTAGLGPGPGTRSLLFILNGIIENHTLHPQISGWVSITQNQIVTEDQLVTNLGVNTEFEQQTKREGWLANNEFSERSSELVQDPTSGPG